MSYDIDLLDPVTGRTIRFDAPHVIRGGTYAMDGTDEASLNVTYNYAEHYYRLIDNEKGIRWLYGKTAAETTPKLKEAIAALGTDVSDNYWAPTEGNARAALCGLLAFAQLRPDGVWGGD